MSTLQSDLAYSDDDAEEKPRFADRAREWRRKRQKLFTSHQRHVREWICFQEIAEWLCELSGRGVPNDAARNHAYEMLMGDLLLGDFEEHSRSRVRYLHHVTPKSRMTRRWLTNAIETFPANTVRSAYLAHCWIPRQLFERWLAKHELPPSPARFTRGH